MIVVGIYIKDSVTLEYNRVELFNDEKISVNSSIQNVNDISKTYTDFSQTFTVPASKQNNKIFRHWYENSNDNGFSTLVKADAYIEIDTIPFRNGKIQLESANVKDGQPQDYSITFIGALGSLKDKFNGLYLKDLTDTTYDFAYTPTLVKTKVTTLTPTSPATPDIAFPLISSDRYWNYGATGTNDISLTTSPIRYIELFPAIKISAVLNMIANDSNILNLNFNGSFLSDERFTNAYLWLKNSDEFAFKPTYDIITFQNTSALTNTGSNPKNLFNVPPLVSNVIYTNNLSVSTFYSRNVKITITPSAPGIIYTVKTFQNNYLISTQEKTSIVGAQVFSQVSVSKDSNIRFEITSDQTMTFNASVLLRSVNNQTFPDSEVTQTLSKSSNQTLLVPKLAIKEYFPEIKIEDFFSGLLKMFNLTCFSSDGINYTIRQLEEYYTSGTIRDITKYIKSDNVNLNRVKTYKKINFEYEKSESLVNVGFMSNNGIEYGSLFYNTQNDGDEYNIKLPFEDLNFNNLQDKLQVAYALKTDLQKYIPKPVILYDYNPTALTTLTAASDFYFNTNITGGTSTLHNTYKAFGQEYYDGTDTYSLNFNQQQSTLTNELIDKSLYDQYYDNYLSNIFDSKARLIKVSGILPTSLLTTLKLNDRLIIRDKRYLINTFTTDLTTGEVQFELLTDNREVPDTSLVLNLDAGNIVSYPGTGTLWTDLSIYGNNGTLINGPTFDSANDGSIVFDGVNDYVSINASSTIPIGSAQRSLSIWFYTNSSTWAPEVNNLFQYGTNVTRQSFGIDFDIYPKMQLWVWLDDLTFDTTYSLVGWKNITVTYNGSTTLLVYENGINTQTKTLSGALNTTSTTVYIGSLNPTIQSSFYLGNIGQTLMYNRALSSTEVLANFNATKGRYGL